MPDNSNENPNSLKSLFDRANKGKLLDLENYSVETNETEMRAEINNIRNNRSGSSRNCETDNEISNPILSISPRLSFLPRDASSSRELRIVSHGKIACLKFLMQGEDLMFNSDCDLNRI